jgi:NADH-quinone oxidoreductase subunit M
MFGPITHQENQELKDLSGRELAVLAPLIVAIFAMGIFPNFFFDRLEPSISRFLARSGAPVAEVEPPTMHAGLETPAKGN